LSDGLGSEETSLFGGVPGRRKKRRERDALGQRRRREGETFQRTSGTQQESREGTQTRGELRAFERSEGRKEGQTRVAAGLDEGGSKREIKLTSVSLEDGNSSRSIVIGARRSEEGDHVGG